MNQNLRKAFEKMDEAFTHASDGIKEEFKKQPTTAAPPIVNEADRIKINLSGRRFTTAFHLLKSAAQMLVTNKTSIRIRKRSS